MRYEHQPTAGSWLRAGGFDWSDADQYVGDDSNGERETGELPSGGPLWRFARVAEVISAPSAPSRPWVLGSADRVVKAYDLRAFDGTARMRALAEAEAARALSDISGVVTTYRTGTVGDWLIIEMERLGPSIADHVAAVRAGDAAPLGRRRWGVLLEDAAATLYAIHRRGLLHRDVKPANLMFDSLQSRLVVGDFSIASTRATRLRRRAAGADDPSLGTTRFIAPEQFEGRIGPAVDQYAFGVTATDALDGDDTPAARAVIARATAVDPEDRYPSVAEFGAALRAALDDTAPRRASSRLERVAPKWRHAWGPGAVAFFAMYGGLFVLRPSGINWAAGIVIPALVALAATLVMRFALGMGAARTQLRVGLVDRPWFPVVAFAGLLAAFSPLIAHDPRDAGKYALYSTFGAFAATAAFGATPRNAGEWLVRSLRRWERWREPHRRSPARWWGMRALAVVGIVAFSALPAAVTARWPRDDDAAPFPGRAAARAAADFRAALLSGDATAGCALTSVPRSAEMVGCETWFPAASSRVRDDVRRGGPAFRPDDLRQLSASYNEGSELHTWPTWSLRRSGGERPYMGTMSREGDDGRTWSVSFTRNAPSRDPMSTEQANWTYELVLRGRRWVVTAARVCDVQAQPRCVTITQVKRRDWPGVARRGAPR